MFGVYESQSGRTDGSLWVELSVETPPEFVEPLTQVFTEHGEGGVAIELPGGHNPDEGESAPDPDRVTVRTYIPHDRRLEQRYSRIDTALRLIAHVGDISDLRVRVVEEQEWADAWKEHFHVLRVGERAVIVPTWRAYEPREDDVVISIDPGMAFGTGHHPTTRMCMELLEQYIEPGYRVLDLGCGSGILSILAAKLGASEVLGLEIDSTAAAVAASNVQMNGVQDIVKIQDATLPNPHALRGNYDLLVANVSAKVITDLAEHVVDVVRSGGRLIFSGILDRQRAGVVERMGELGVTFDDGSTDEDWEALVGRVG